MVWVYPNNIYYISIFDKNVLQNILIYIKLSNVKLKSFVLKFTINYHDLFLIFYIQ